MLPEVKGGEEGGERRRKEGERGGREGGREGGRKGEEGVNEGLERKCNTHYSCLLSEVTSEVPELPPKCLLTKPCCRLSADAHTASSSTLTADTSCRLTADVSLTADSSCMLSHERSSCILLLLPESEPVPSLLHT